MRDTTDDAMRHTLDHLEEFVARKRSEPASPYERIGGGPAVKKLVDRLYDLVLLDPDLVRYFADVEIHQLKWHQAALLTSLLGGPNLYRGRELDVAHKPLQICRCHYRRVVYYLGRVMVELDLPDDVINSVIATTVDIENKIVGATLKQRIWCWIGLHRSSVVSGAA